MYTILRFTTAIPTPRFYHRSHSYGLHTHTTRVCPHTSHHYLCDSRRCSTLHTSALIPTRSLPFLVYYVRYTLRIFVPVVPTTAFTVTSPLPHTRSGYVLVDLRSYLVVRFYLPTRCSLRIPRLFPRSHTVTHVYYLDYAVTRLCLPFTTTHDSPNHRFVAFHVTFTGVDSTVDILLI